VLRYRLREKRRYAFCLVPGFVIIFLRLLMHIDLCCSTTTSSAKG
jgi:hypothetical protein